VRLAFHQWFPASIRGGVEVSESSHQTVQLRHGKHPSPARGACVVELASMLAGERFSDHPRAVCPVLAAFLRSYNDLLSKDQLDELYPYASMVVGTASSAVVRRKRARRLLEWAGQPRRRSLLLRVGPWDATLLAAARHAVRLDRDVRRIEVTSLLEELVAMGRSDAVAAAPVTPQEHDPGVEPLTPTKSVAPAGRAGAPGSPSVCS
jgi:hypothetical protein